jgi:hypothetical protein
MFPSALSLSGIATGGIDLTADFTPLFIGLVLLVCLSVLGIAFAVGVHDTREAQQKAVRTTDKAPSLPKAA